MLPTIGEVLAFEVVRRGRPRVIAGEGALHNHIRGMTVKELLAVLHKRGITAEFLVNVWTADNSGVTWKASAGQVDGSRPVNDVIPAKRGHVIVFIDAGPHAHPPAKYRDEYHTYGKRYHYKPPQSDWGLARVREPCPMARVPARMHGSGDVARARRTRRPGTMGRAAKAGVSTST
ncbi:MAG: hypothetical protein ACRDN9_10300 [Streptosporangiaceae bacterium]